MLLREMRQCYSENILEQSTFETLQLSMIHNSAFRLCLVGATGAYAAGRSGISNVKMP